MKKFKKNIILFVGSVPIEDIINFKKKIKGKYRLALAYTDTKDDFFLEKRKKIFDVLINIKTSSEAKIAKSILPYASEILVATCRSEAKIHEFAKVIQFLPYLRTPTSQSLLWSIDKLSMRRKFKAFNKKITPKYTVIHDSTQKNIKKTIKKIRFPLVIKPSGLAQSLLVSVCFHHEEFEKNLKITFRKIYKLHKQYKDISHKPTVIVEEFMDGDMYSIDGYVNSRGKIYFCPIVSINTGRSIGFDDFFGYKQITPTKLKTSSVKEAEKVASDAIHALGLRSSSAHVELMKTENGWKVIEVGPRLGGFRSIMYRLSYHIDHTKNDILIRIPQKPHIPKKIYGHTAAMKFFAPKEGTIFSITGIKKAQALTSFYKININKKIGDRAIFAKNGGKSIFNIILFNKERSKLLADIRRLEQVVKIKTK